MHRRGRNADYHAGATRLNRTTLLTTDRIRELLLRHGTCQSQPATDWEGDIPLPDAIAQFYRDIGPMNVIVEGYGNPTFLPSLAKLWSRQAGYRWHGRTLERIANWHDDWIVIADEGADPYIFHDGKILFANHGTGGWDPDEIYPDINTMAACIATLGEVRLDAGEDFTDDDSIIRPKFIDEAIQKLTAILGDKASAEAKLQTSGWL